jgi:hypothetical protein
MPELPPIGGPAHLLRLLLLHSPEYPHQELDQDDYQQGRDWLMESGTKSEHDDAQYPPVDRAQIEPPPHTLSPFSKREPGCSVARPPQFNYRHEQAKTLELEERPEPRSRAPAPQKRWGWPLLEDCLGQPGTVFTSAAE